MRRSIRQLCVLLLLALSWISSICGQGLPQTDPAKVGLSPERLARIDRVMKESVRNKEISGAVTLVARRGKVAHFATHGLMDVEANKPMQPDTIFRIASMTKPITSVAVMILNEEGRLLLSDPVSKYIPEFKNPRVLVADVSGIDSHVPAKREITVRHLITHTSGLTYQWDPRLGMEYKESGITHGLVQDKGTILEKMKILGGIPLLRDPGDKFTYSLSIDVLGALVEVASGMPFDQFLQERIFQPLGMKDTQFFLLADKKMRLASVYKRDANGPIERVGEDPVPEGEGFVWSMSYPYGGPQSYFSGGGGLLSTASDYVRFAQAMLNGGELDGNRILSPKTVELMTTDQVGALSPAGFGLGFGVARPGDARDSGSVGTYGWGGFFYTTFFVDPKEELVGVFMAQLHPTGGATVADKFRVLAFQSIVE